MWIEDVVRFFVGILDSFEGFEIADPVAGEGFAAGGKDSGIDGAEAASGFE